MRKRYAQGINIIKYTGLVLGQFVKFWYYWYYLGLSNCRYLPKLGVTGTTNAEIYVKYPPKSADIATENSQSRQYYKVILEIEMSVEDILFISKQ